MNAIKDVLRRLLGAPLASADPQAFRDETIDVNRRRLRVILPLMVLVHAGHVAMFWISPRASR